MRFFITVSLLMILAACGSKEVLDASIEIQDSGTDNTLHDIYFTDEMTGYAVGGDRYFEATLLKTIDAGETWSEIVIDDLEKTLFEITFLDDGRGIISAFDSKIVRSDLGGDNWNISQLQTEPRWFPMRSVEFKNDVGLLAGGIGFRDGFISRSENGGISWSHSHFDFEFRSISWKNENEVFVCGYGVVMKSEDAGQTWKLIDVEGDLFTDIQFVSQDIAYITGHQGSILKTEDGGTTWTKIRNANLPLQSRRRIEGLWFFSETEGIVVGEKGLFWKTTDGGESWEAADLGAEENLESIFCVSSATCYCVGENGVIVKVTL